MCTSELKVEEPTYNLYNQIYIWIIYKHILTYIHIFIYNVIADKMVYNDIYDMTTLKHRGELSTFYFNYKL